ncbi:quinone-dependent dihydroorotate dehydrogenase [Pelagicoccus albus]|uniref:Dihydroorotate dehydrogenase (quinone) n=1 Tax=Pelagicoccus albus TaxID=415222 RepID=A0A7X1E7R0_9BACT|nr:quinone-dependent dihydroorotate dehydrogenase [Pelagicoccus albus]MBC2605403.1 quinone-dependent dihydroorotate dehydrogenase [Pelagicoccus albus]
MGAVYKNLLKPLFFKLDPERAHEVTVDALRVMRSVPGLVRLLSSFNQLPASSKPVEAFGVKFPNRIGLAAGFDKNAVCWEAFEAFGFGHVEIGTVTRKAQPGNPKPRLFRYPEHDAVLNRMGFNNHGAQALAARLENQPGPSQRHIPLGVNIGKSKVTPLDEAVEDYLGSFGLLADYADYVVINVSSPNTPDLRKLQEESRLRELLSELVSANSSRESALAGSRKPILLKIAPDLSEGQVDDILQILFDLELDGIIATNTTMARDGVFKNVNQAGGLSGRPICKMSTDMIAYISKATEGKLPIIGVGGITDPDTAAEKLDAGATLVQVYSGMIFEGPFIGKRVARHLAKVANDI